MQTALFIEYENSHLCPPLPVYINPFPPKKVHFHKSLLDCVHQKYVYTSHLLQAVEEFQEKHAQVVAMCHNYSLVPRVSFDLCDSLTEPHALKTAVSAQT
jgi:hypothetical protein